jgi:hypothetical protein
LLAFVVGLATVKPAGRESVILTPLTGVDVVFVKVIRNTETPFVWMEAGEKVFVTDTGEDTEKILAEVEKSLL